MTQDTKAAPLALAESDIDNIVKWPLRMFDTPEEIARAVAKATAACMQTKYRLAAAASPPQAGLLRYLNDVQHEGTANERAVANTVLSMLAAPPAVEAGQVLTDERLRSVLRVGIKLV